MGKKRRAAGKTDTGPSGDIVAWLEAANATADGLPDGEWWPHMADTVRAFHKARRTRYRTGYDPYEIVRDWIENRQGVHALDGTVI